MMKRCLILLLATGSLLSGCATSGHRPAPDADDALQGEWQLVNYSNRDMSPAGRGRKQVFIPTAPVLYIVRNGHLTVIEGTNIVTSTPCFVTDYYDAFYDQTTRILHQHPERMCPDSINWHDWFHVEDNQLYMGAWDIEMGMGCQNAHVYKFIPAKQRERTYEGREQAPGGDSLEAAPRE